VPGGGAFDDPDLALAFGYFKFRYVGFGNQVDQCLELS
jgi:hypothetical protein